MNGVAYHVCKAFVDRRERKELLSFLSVPDLPSTPWRDLTLGFESAEENLNRTHFSWLEPLLRPLTKSEIALYLASLPSTKREQLKKSLLFTGHLPALRPLAKNHFQAVLWDKVVENRSSLVPVACLPESPLNGLLELTEKQVELLLPLLGLYDLSIEMKQIIETTKLKTIHAALSPQQQLFMRKLMPHKESASLKKIGLGTWDGGKEGLQDAIVKRGLYRLGKSLADQDSDLVWYVGCRVEKHHGDQLQKIASESSLSPRFLIDQVVSLISYLQHTYP
jgi:hypothetical protein